ALRWTGLEEEDFQAWSKSNLACAPLVLGTQLGVFALFQARQPLGLIWLVFTLQWVMAFLFIGRFVIARGHPLHWVVNPAVVHWVGVCVASLLLLPLTCPPGGLMEPADVLGWYPPLALLIGLTFLIQGGMYWGQHYLGGLGYFALAVLLWLLPAWAPLAFGLFLSVHLVYL